MNKIFDERKHCVLKEREKKTLCTFFIYKISTKILWKGKVESNDKEKKKKKKKAWLFM
jgi:hypothetical protein